MALFPAPWALAQVRWLREWGLVGGGILNGPLQYSFYVPLGVTERGAALILGMGRDQFAHDLQKFKGLQALLCHPLH